MVWIVHFHTNFLLSSDVDSEPTQTFGGFVRLNTSLLEPRYKRFGKNEGRKIAKMQRIRTDTSLSGQIPEPQTAIK